MVVTSEIGRGFQVVLKRNGHDFDVSYVPRVPGGKDPKNRSFLASVRGDNESVHWQHAPTIDTAHLAELDNDARRRVGLARKWLLNLDRLIATAKKWADELDWATKVIDKAMDDSEIGNYVAPALLFQQETTRMLLEPVARMVPGAEGAVDLYVMPAYDDVASLYYYDGRWNLHYAVPDERASRDANPRPFTKTNFRRVVEEMRQHAQ